jgi:Terminase large subunit, T4likevirus-type, N-terminal/Terminase RNaseH-like domain
MSRSLDGVLIKAPHKVEHYTSEQVEEFMACADPVTGPLYFLNNFFYIQHPVKGKLLFEPFEYQVKLIETYHNYRFSISMMPRQTGKSTAAAGYLLWYAMFVPDSRILIAAHQYSGAFEIMSRIRYGYELCPDHIRAGVTTYNKGSIDFENGSRIISAATTENTGRGLSISLLYCDEFAFVRPTIAKEFWTSISPTLATGGKAIITSTPNSDEDQFATIWKEANKCEDEYGNITDIGKNGFKSYRSYWQDHPDRDEVWAAEQRSQLGEERFRREMGCEFLIFDETLIAPTTLIDLVPTDPIHRTGQVRWFKPIEPGKMYIVALDPSLGTGGDPSAIEIFDARTATQVGEWRHNKTRIPDQIRILADICKYINETVKDTKNIYYSVENNTIGEAALISISQFGEPNIPGYFLSESKSTSRIHRKGFTTTNKTKLTACSKLKTMMETNRMKIYSAPLISELKTFVALGTGYEAKIGETDDLVMATLLAIRMMQQLQTYHSDMDRNMRDFDREIVQPMPFFASSSPISIY